MASIDQSSPDKFLSDVSRYGFQLSGSSSIPLYHQLQLILVQGIREGQLQTGDRFPSEDAIAAHFDVSRPTANRAVQELIRKGWLERRRGRGTFVRAKQPAQLSLLQSSLSFSDEIGALKGHRTRFISRTTIPANAEDADALGVTLGDDIVYLRRLHSIAGRVVMVCDSKLPALRFPELEKTPLVDGSLFATLQTTYGCAIRRAERCVEAAQALDAEVASLLEVPQFAPILLLTGLAFDEDGERVESMTAYVKEGVLFRSVIDAQTRGASPSTEECPHTHPPAEGAC